MSSTIDTNAAQQGRDFANKTADKAKGGIDQAASALSDKVDSATQQSKPFFDQVGAVAGKVRDSAADASDSILTYTKENPAKALLYAAGIGALLLTLLKALMPTKD